MQDSAKLQGARGSDFLRNRLASLSFVLAFTAMVVIFGSLRPEIFLQLRTVQIILRGVAIGLPIALGLTLPLILGDFDLSIAAVASMTGGIAVVLLVRGDVPWVVAVGVAIAIALTLGLLNGLIVALLDLSAFIVTLAMSSVAVGVEFLFTSQRQAVLSGVEKGHSSYVFLGQGAFMGVALPLLIGGVFLAATWVFTRHIETGRRMYAIGSNVRAAYLSGINVVTLRVVGLAIAALGAAITGIILTAQGAAYTPRFAGGLLLPSFAAAFVGTAVFRAGLFTVVGTAIGLVFLETLQVGMIMLNLDTWALNSAQGAVLALAVIASRLIRGRPR